MTAGNSKQLGWGLVGASYVASRWMVNGINTNDESNVVGVASASKARAERFARRHAIPAAYDSLDSLLADERVDIVYVSTTNDRHASHTIAAAKAGKHVLCEKPLALTVADAEAMCKACEAAGVLLGTNHDKREAATHRTIRALLAAGELGEVLAAHVRFATYLPERQQTWRLYEPGHGAGVVLDLTVHDVDLLRFLLDDDVDEVAAFTAQQGLAAGEIEDSIVGTMRFRAGTLATFHDTFTLPHAGTALELHGTDASIIAQEVLGDQPSGEVYLRHGSDLERVDVGEREDLFVRTVRRFNSAVRGDGDPTATGRDGLLSLSVGLACLESARTRSAVQVGRRGATPMPAAATQPGAAMETSRR